MLRRFILSFTLLAFSVTAAYALETKAKQAILIDDTTNTVLFEKNADESMHPSSMSKLMTVYITFSRLKDGTLKLTDEFPVSEAAWSKQGSKGFMELGSTVDVEDLIQSIVIQSGNDACIVMAEGIAGSEENFAKLMNETAAKLGMKHSHFVNATGWPDDDHLMTARDLALLAQHIIHDFPEYYHYFSELEFTHHGIRQYNRNLLLHSNIGVDGLKTGHTDIAGYGITASAKDAEGRRLLVVVNGLSDEKERASEAEMLLRAGFRDYKPLMLAKSGQEIDRLPVWMGEQKNVAAIPAKDVSIIVPVQDRDKVTFAIRYQSPLKAPITKGTPIAELVATVPNQQSIVIPLVAGEDVTALGAMQRILPNLSYYLFGNK